jgi:uncharacterized membrane protein YphA (DoxX/SURF4 family)
MTKIISIYVAQILLGMIAMAAGTAKIVGAGLVAQQFQALGLGHGFLTVAGGAEILAGLCLLLPRGGVVGGGVLACVMVGAIGMTLGHMASTAAAPTPSVTATAYKAPIRAVRPRTEWDI